MNQQPQLFQSGVYEDEEQLDPLLEQSLQGIVEEMTKISMESTEKIQEYWKTVAQDIQSNILDMNQQTNDTFYRFGKWQYRIENPTISPICSKSIADNQNNKAFRCFDCMSINTALMCYQCFSKSNHKGHSYRQFQSAGGCCDCGDSQLWNQNGFCPDHNSKSVVPNLPIQMIETFKKEMLFVFYFYFLLVKRENQFSQMRQFLGKRIFSFLINFSNHDYESKVMVGQLLSSYFQHYYKEGELKGRLITLIFNLNPKYKELFDLKSISFSMYPVEYFRAILIRQYFDLTAKNQFLYENPLKKFNFQYLICVKLIIKMIKQKQLRPIQLSRTIRMKDKEHIISIFKKYFEDVSYLMKKKESQQYFEMHFSMLDINHMLFYRQMASVDGGFDLGLDEFGLKLVGACLEYFKENKQMLRRGIEQLFTQIHKNGKLSYCMPHERAFALYLITYLQGHLQHLQDKAVADQIISILGFNEQNKSGRKQMFIRVIKKGLLNLVFLQTNKMANERNEYQKYFFSIYPEKNFQISLDLIYHKSLYLLSQSIIDYGDAVREVFKELRQISNCQLGVAQLSVFISKMLTDTLSQPRIANFLGYPNIQYTTLFNLRLIATYQHRMAIKQLKSLSNYFINNPQLFDKILHQYVRIQKGKIMLTQQVTPLQMLLFKDYFIHFKYYNQINCSKTHHLQPIPYLSQLYLFTPEIVHLLIQNCRITYNSFQNEKDANKKQTFLQTLQVQINALLLVYLLTKSKQIIQFFDESGYEISKMLKCNNFRQQIGCLLVQKHNAQKSKQETMNQQQQYRRKEKNAVKRKEKEAILKKKQQATLKLFSPAAEGDTNAESCVYCKQMLDKQYELLGFINLTNFVAKSMKSERIHFFLTTCGHKMHVNCYNKYLEEKKTLEACFLCQKKTNFGIISRQVSSQNASSISITFFDTLLASLSSIYEEGDDMFDQFYSGQCNQNILQAAIVSLCRELIYCGLHQFQTFKKYSFPAYLIVYEMLAHSDKQWLKEAFKNIEGNQKVVESEWNQLCELELFGYKLLKSKLLAQQYIANEASQCKQSDNLAILIQMLQSKSSIEIEIEPIGLITMDRIFIKLPKNIHDLHQMMGECPFCHKITNWLYYCLICGWKCCNKQINYFYSHSQHHYQGSLFISAGNGKTSIISMKNVTNQESIYENQFGQDYSHIQQNLKKQTLLSFELNESKLHNLFVKLLTHSLQHS